MFKGFSLVHILPIFEVLIWWRYTLSECYSPVFIGAIIIILVIIINNATAPVTYLLSLIHMIRQLLP